MYFLHRLLDEIWLWRVILLAPYEKERTLEWRDKHKYMYYPKCPEMSGSGRDVEYFIIKPGPSLL